MAMTSTLIRNNAAAVDGGAMELLGTDTTLVGRNVAFINNTAKDGGAIYMRGIGGE